MSRDPMNERNNTTGNAVDNDMSREAIADEGAMTHVGVREKLSGLKGKKLWRSVD